MSERSRARFVQANTTYTYQQALQLVRTHHSDAAAYAAEHGCNMKEAYNQLIVEPWHKKMIKQDYPTWRRKVWELRLNQALPNPIPTSCSWSSPSEIAKILSHFGRANLNHTFFPDGGGLDVEKFTLNGAGFLELQVEPRMSYICMPTRLHFEHFEDNPEDSFFLLESDGLEPSGVTSLFQNHEEVVELEPGRFVERYVWDEQSLGYDEFGRSMPLPDTARVVIRYTKGQFLIASKGSIWNRRRRIDVDLYMPSHNYMTATELRASLQNNWFIRNLQHELVQRRLNEESEEEFERYMLRRRNELRSALALRDSV